MYVLQVPLLKSKSQCLVLATRPLLFYFWQKRLESRGPLRITSRGGARSLLRVCVSSAKQTMRILEALQGQDLLGKETLELGRPAYIQLIFFRKLSSI